MTRCHLRIYRGPEDSDNSSDARPEERIRVRLVDIYPLLADALESDRTWLRDFEDEELQISPDLYDCIRAYEHWRPSA